MADASTLPGDQGQSEVPALSNLLERASDKLDPIQGAFFEVTACCFGDTDAARSERAQQQQPDRRPSDAIKLQQVGSCSVFSPCSWRGTK